MAGRKIALITGITGQDGSYLTELLLGKGYDVHGIIRRSSSFNTGRLEAITGNRDCEHERLHLHYGDMTDGTSLSELVTKIKPDEIYNLAAQSHVRVSFDQPLYTADVVAMGTMRLLEAARRLNESGEKQAPVKFYQAGSSEMFGKVAETPQRETTPFRPRSPYACAKVMAYYAAVNYREAYGLFACNGVLFNHSGPRRGETFVSRKISKAVARIALGVQTEPLRLGNLEAKRDWGFAGDYVRAMWLMLQQDEPDDFVIATGETHSVRDFADLAFREVGLAWGEHVSVDERYFRPSEVDLLLGDATKAKEKLGWTPSVTFRELVTMMVRADVQEERKRMRGEN